MGVVKEGKEEKDQKRTKLTIEDRLNDLLSDEEKNADQLQGALNAIIKDWDEEKKKSESVDMDMDTDAQPPELYEEVYLIEQVKEKIKTKKNEEEKAMQFGGSK